MTVAQLIAEINAGIYTNNNQEITAAVLNPILQDMVNQINDLTGQLDDLNTTDQSDLVAAINELKTAVDNLTVAGAVMADGSVPFIAPQVMVAPTTDSHGINRGFLLNVLHEYTKAQGFGVVDKPYNAVQAWDLEGEQVAKTDGITGDMLIADPTNIKPGFVYLYMATQDAIGGHDITFGSKYKFDGLIETSPNGANLFFCVAATNNIIYVQNLLKYPTGGQVDTVSGDSVDNSDPANPIVNAIPLSGTTAGNPVTGSIETTQLNALVGNLSSIDDLIVGIGDDLDIPNSADKHAIVRFQDFLGMRSGLKAAFSQFNDKWINLMAVSTNTESYAEIVTFNSNSRGLIGNFYYGANYDDNTYVQKKYVDDNFQPIGGGSGGQVDSVSGIVNETEVTGTATDPIVGLAQAVKDSLALADTAIQSETDPVFSASPASGIAVGDIANWNDAFSWGNHASAGYLKSMDIDTFAELDIIVSDATLAKHGDNVSAFNDDVGLVHTNGSTPFTNPQTGVDPTNAQHLATKSYVDGLAGVQNETDPIFSASAASGIVAQDITNWNNAFAWGNHANAGYLTGFTETDPVFTASPAASIPALPNHATKQYVPVESNGTITWTEMEEDDIPPYPNDGNAYVLQELNGTLTWASPQSGPAGQGWTGGSYNSGTGVVTFTSNDGLGFATGDLRGSNGTDFQVGEGTAFPASPANWERYYRTDVSRMFEWDHIRGKWLSVDEFLTTFQKAGASGNTGEFNFVYLNFDTIADNIVITEAHWSNDASAQGTVNVKRNSVILHTLNVNGLLLADKKLNINVSGGAKIKADYDLTTANGTNQILVVRYRLHLT